MVVFASVHDLERGGVLSYLGSAYDKIHYTYYVVGGVPGFILWCSELDIPSYGYLRLRNSRNEYPAGVELERIAVLRINQLYEIKVPNGEIHEKALPLLRPNVQKAPQIVKRMRQIGDPNICHYPGSIVVSFGGGNGMEYLFHSGLGLPLPFKWVDIDLVDNLVIMDDIKSYTHLKSKPNQDEIYRLPRLPMEDDVIDMDVILRGSYAPFLYENETIPELMNRMVEFYNPVAISLVVSMKGKDPGLDEPMFHIVEDGYLHNVDDKWDRPARIVRREEIGLTYYDVPIRDVCIECGLDPTNLIKPVQALTSFWVGTAMSTLPIAPFSRYPTSLDPFLGVRSFFFRHKGLRLLTEDDSLIQMLATARADPEDDIREEHVSYFAYNPTFDIDDYLYIKGMVEDGDTVQLYFPDDVPYEWLSNVTELAVRIECPDRTPFQVPVIIHLTHGPGCDLESLQTRLENMRCRQDAAFFEKK
jgi:hypothetical protein